MFEEYKIKLLDFYHYKKSIDELSDNLRNLQRSKLRQECLHVFVTKNTARDYEIIKAFFDPSGKINDPVKSIEKFELDRFRPLISFLQERKNIRDDAAVKLLAWLMDFDTYQEWKARKGEGKIVIGPGRSTPTPGLFKKIPDIIIGWLFSKKNTIINCIMLILLVVGIFFLVVKITVDTTGQPSADEKCMYWTGNHYKPVKCNEKVENANVAPLNPRALNNFKKIDLVDTLTKYSLGKVWYSKIDGKCEFFTDSGTHPVNSYKKLKPLSKYILSNYVSYYRYLLTYLKWSVCIISTVMLLMVCIIYLLKQPKKI